MFIFEGSYCEKIIIVCTIYSSNLLGEHEILAGHCPPLEIWGEGGAAGPLPHPLFLLHLNAVMLVNKFCSDIKITASIDAEEVVKT